MPGRLRLLASVVLCELLCCHAIAATEPPDDGRPPATAIQSLQAMPLAEIDRGDLVRVQGVVTFRQGRQFLSVQDDNAGIWVRFDAPPADIAACLDSLRPGDLVDVVGTLDRGAYSPTLVASRIGMLGVG